MSALELVFGRILSDEGGIATLDDGAGETRFGQTATWLATFNLPTPQTASDALQNYLKWAHLTGLDLIVGDIMDLLGWAMVDGAVNSGHRTPIQALQRRIGALADGIIGPQTMASLAPMNRKRIGVGILADHVRFYGHLDQQNGGTFAESWNNRIAEQIDYLGGLI